MANLIPTWRWSDRILCRIVLEMSNNKEIVTMVKHSLIRPIYCRMKNSINFFGVDTTILFHLLSPLLIIFCQYNFSFHHFDTVESPWKIESWIFCSFRCRVVFRCHTITTVSFWLATIFDFVRFLCFVFFP